MPTCSAFECSFKNCRIKTAGKSVHNARLKVRSRVENIAGVQLRIFESYEAGSDEYSLTGLAKGGDKIKLLKKAYADATEILVELATLQTAFITLDEIIRTTNRRVNGLEYRYIPRIENTIKYIEGELDEKEREEFFRLKMVKNKKQQQREEKEARDESHLESESHTGVPDMSELYIAESPIAVSDSSAI